MHVAGDRGRAAAVTALLSDIDARVDLEDSALNALSNLDRRSAAVVLVTPLPLLECEAAVSLLRIPSSRTKTPILVVVSGDVSDAEARQLYQRGAYGVYAWPRDGLLLARAVSAMLAGTADEYEPLDSNSLDRALRRRLDWIRGLATDVAVDARDGDPELRGRVDSRWQKKRLVEFVAAMPGVEAVDASGLLVDSSRSRDPEERALLARVRRVLAELSDGLAGSVGVTVKDGGAAVAFGTLSKGKGFRAIARALLDLPGIESVFDATRKNARDAERAGRIERDIAASIRRDFPEIDFDVCVVRETALLTGEVEGPEVANAVEEIARSHPDILRIANHLEVRPAPLLN